MEAPGSSSGIGNKCFASSCTTQFHNTVFRYTWTINDYKAYYNLSRGCISSSIFPNFPTDGIKWCIKHNPKFGDCTMMNFCLVLLSNHFESFQTFCEFSILDAKLNSIHEITIIRTFSEENILAYFDMIEYSTLFGKNNRYLPNNSLILRCKITILGENENIVSEHHPRFQKDLTLMLLEDSEFYDLTFSVGGRELYAHKAILAARSTVFSAMFEDETEERIDYVKIDDLDYEVVEKMLRFIYTNKTSKIDKIAHNLFIAADKYALDELRFRCVKVMFKNLSIENAAQYYLVAAQHNVEDLKNRVKSVIVTNSDKVVLTSGFQSAFQLNPELFIDLHLL